MPTIRTVYLDLADAGVQAVKKLRREKTVRDADGRERKVRQQDRIVPVTDDRGRVVDFHSLRGTFATRLAQASVKPLHLKRLMRHASIRTTDKHYTDLQLADLAGAVRTLSSPDGQAEALRATGTDGPQVSRIVSRNCARSSATGRDVAQAQPGSDPPTPDAQTPHVCEVTRDSAALGEVEPIGLEPTTSCMPCRGHASEIGPGDAENGGQAGGVTDSARLSRVIEAWAELPEAVRVAIHALAEAAASITDTPPTPRSAC
jgi:hypothetical protein